MTGWQLRRPTAPLRMLTTLAAAVLLVVVAGPAGAQSEQAAPDPAGPLGAFELVEIDAVVEHIPTDEEGDSQEEPAPQPIALGLQVDTGPVARSDLRVVTSVYTSTPDVESLRAAVAGELPTLFSSTSSELPDLAAGTSRVVRLDLNPEELALRGEDRTGVYPLQVQLFSGAELLGTQTTSVIVLPERQARPLPTTLLLDVVAPTAPLLGDQPDAGFAELLRPTGAVQSTSTALEDLVARGTAAGLTLAADGRTLEELSGLADGWVTADDAVVDAASRPARRADRAMDVLAALARRSDTEVVAYPYGPADLVALVRGGLASEARAAVADASATVSDLLDQPVNGQIVVPPAGLDAATLAVVGQTDPSAVVLRERAVTFAASQTLEPLRRLRTADGGEVRVLVPDAGLSDGLRNDPSTAGLQSFLAETALAWLSAGEAQASAGVLLDIDALSLGADDGRPALDLTAVHDAILAAPWLRPVSLSTMTEELQPSARLARLAYGPDAVAAELPPEYIAAYGRARDALDPLASMLPADDRSPFGFAQLLEPMPSTRYRLPSRQTAGLLRGNQVITRLDALTRAVEILPSASITLTATTGEVPVTVANTSDVTLRVRVALDSRRFEFDEGSSQDITITPGASQRLSFAARSRNPGGFAPISVALTDPAGTLTLATTQLSVRSTAIPVVGLVATIGSALFLTAWSVRRLRRRTIGTSAAPDTRQESAA
ncbi:DUF6049 family protein [Euzebya tangerina]|uniref:DUF6049 family protein n=1 Tax=Euzebya tangerina TaxID=591198 RepID=UPI0013C328E1|nr:DUF6049 family protein [Euzebya tangerina]